MAKSKLVFVLTITVFLMLLVAGTALADHGSPVGGCPNPDKWELHHFMEHADHEHEHAHIGLAKDLNGDGYICVKHLATGKHVHKDNTNPLG